jgi:hypothetical protein
MDAFEFGQYLQVMYNIVVTAVCIGMFLAMAGHTYPDFKRAAGRVLVKAKQRDKFYRD